MKYIRPPFEWAYARDYDKDELILVDDTAAPGLSNAPAGGREASLAVEETRPSGAAAFSEA